MRARQPGPRGRRPPGNRRSGSTRCWCFWTAPTSPPGQALAGLLRKDNAGSNTTADHISVLEQALASLPAHHRPDPDNPDAPKVLIRSDSAGDTYGFAAACRTSGVGFSLGAAIDAPIRDAVEVLNSADGGHPAIDSGAGLAGGYPVDPSARNARIRVRSCGSPTPMDTASPVFLPTPPTVWCLVSSPGWNCGIANTPASKTGSARPKPPACATCRSTPSTPTPPGSKSSWQQSI